MRMTARALQQGALGASGPSNATTTSQPRAGMMGRLLLALVLVIVAVLNTYSQHQLISGGQYSAVSSARTLRFRNLMMDQTTPFSTSVSTTRPTSDSTNDIFQGATSHTHTNGNNGKDLPRFVWHVGPMKTGTTTLQLGLGGMENSGTLKRDHWVYAKFRSFDANKDPLFWTNFQSTMDQYKQQGHHVVVSSENFSITFRESHYEKVKQLLQSDWRIEVVIGYRPYFEWVPSLWSEIHKIRGMGENKANIAIPEVAWKKGSVWKKPVARMFPDFYGSIGPLFADSIYQFTARHLPVTMLHLYQDPTFPLRTAFICNILQAPASCERSRHMDAKDGMMPRRANVKSMDEIHINALVLEAAQQGWIDMQRYSRATVMTGVVDHFVETNATIWDLPFVCPDQPTLDQLWNKTQEIEQRIYPQLAASDEQREQHLREYFAKLVDDKTYCHLDLTAMRNDLEWQTFFSQYHQSSIINSPRGEVLS